jgi:hypothetical protein
MANRTNNDLQNSTQKTKDRATRTPLKIGGELRCLQWESAKSQTLWQKRWFKIPFLNLSFICSNIPTVPAYEVYISQFIRYSRACAPANSKQWINIVWFYYVIEPNHLMTLWSMNYYFLANYYYIIQPNHSVALGLSKYLRKYSLI